MKGVLVASHGLFAKGIADSIRMFLGDDIPQFDYLCLSKTDDPAKFGQLIKEKIEALDKGDGVIVCADLFGGTPFNQTLPFLNDKVDLIAGINFPLMLELLSTRTFVDDIDIANLVGIAKDGVKNSKDAMSKLTDDDDE